VKRESSKDKVGQEDKAKKTRRKPNEKNEECNKLRTLDFGCSCLSCVDGVDKYLGGRGAMSLSV